MLNGIDPAGTAGWGEIAGWIMGSAVVLLVLTAGAGAVLGLWGRAWFSPAALKRGWAMVALGALGGSILAAGTAATQWGANLGTSALMPEGARPGKVAIEKQAPKQTCNRQAVRDFNKEDPKPSVEEIKRVVAKITNEQFDKEIVDRPMKTNEVVVDSLKWYAEASGSQGDCSANNETVANCTEVEVHGTQVIPGVGPEPRRAPLLERFTVGENCESA